MPEAFLSLISIFAIMLIIYGPWQELCTDFARQLVFEKRDALFDLAADGYISFDSPEYRYSRRTMNLLIRFAHELSLFQLMLFLPLLLKSSGPKSVSEDTIIDSIEDLNVRQKVQGYVQGSRKVMVYMVLAKAPILMIFAIPPLLVKQFFDWIMEAIQFGANHASVQSGDNHVSA